jgi:hypothetical protein
MNYEPKILNTIRNDLSNPNCEGFFLESDGNEMTVRRINNWQFDVTTESWRGTVNTDYKLQSHQILDLVYGWLLIDDHCNYIPHYPKTKWTDSQVERFMSGLCPMMCNPFFNGFTLSADGTQTYTVRRYGIEWDVDGKRTDFCGVLHMTRAKLAEGHMWEFAEL